MSVERIKTQKPVPPAQWAAQVFGFLLYTYLPRRKAVAFLALFSLVFLISLGLEFKPAIAQLPPQPDVVENPVWKVLVLVYSSADFTYADPQGEHHVVAQMTLTERTRAVRAARRFVLEDVPALTSGSMRPTITIRYPNRTLTELEATCGHWPSQTITVPDLDPAFDAFFVIWDSSGIDLNTNEPVNLQHCGGMGGSFDRMRTYFVVQMEAIANDQRNVFKHEWGHNILLYFDALGATLKPMVNNHINDTDTPYVHCPTGEPYILEDERDNNPIPNSIYNNESGFTHDYYSGTTATPDQPTRCLGITSAAWTSPPPGAIAAETPSFPNTARFVKPP